LSDRTATLFGTYGFEMQPHAGHTQHGRGNCRLPARLDPGLSNTCRLPTQQPATLFSDAPPFAYRRLVNTSGENPIADAELNKAFQPQY